MSKMSELDAAIAELRKCGETLIGVSETLRELFSSGEPGLMRSWLTRRTLPSTKASSGEAGRWSKVSPSASILMNRP